MKVIRTTIAGKDQRNKNAALLSAEDEALYYKFFPEEKPLSVQEASMLETGKKTHFRIKVGTSGGKKLCLTEDNFNHQVRAEPCRKGSTRQKWFWVGAKLQNLHSRGRCLGLAHRSYPGTDDKTRAGKATAADAVMSLLREAWSHTVSMEFKCTEKDKLLKWEFDSKGRLMAATNQQCLAINEKQNFNAFTARCDVQKHKNNEEAQAQQPQAQAHQRHSSRSTLNSHTIDSIHLKK